MVEILPLSRNYGRKYIEFLKPGGHMVAFGGNAHLSSDGGAIEDAGFEIRDMVNWVYGCLSEDTNIVNSDGVPVSYKSIKPNDKVLCYDKYTKEFFYSEVEEVYEYNIKDTCYRIQSDSTDQIVSRNHRCLVERGGEEVFIFAENLQEKENVPVLEDMYMLHETISNLYKRTSEKKFDLFERMCREINFFSKNWKNKAFRSTVSYESIVVMVCGKEFIRNNEALEKSLCFGLRVVIAMVFFVERSGRNMLTRVERVGKKSQKFG